MKTFRHPQRPKKSSMLIGLDALRQGLQEGRGVDKIMVQKTAAGGVQAEARSLAEQHDLPLQYVPVEKLNALNVGEHDGVVSILSKVTYADFDNLLTGLTEAGEVPLLIMLDGITDVRNIGAIARTAWSMGAHALIIPNRGVGALNEDAVLTSAGALEHLPVCRVASLLKAIDTLHGFGVQVYAAEGKSNTDCQAVDFRIPLAVIMGSEEKGIYPALLKAADIRFRISMHRDFESLNVSVATGMILYELRRQRDAHEGFHS